MNLMLYTDVSSIIKVEQLKSDPVIAELTIRYHFQTRKAVNGFSINSRPLQLLLEVVSIMHGNACRTRAGAWFTLLLSCTTITT